MNNENKNLNLINNDISQRNIYILPNINYIQEKNEINTFNNKIVNQNYNNNKNLSRNNNFESKNNNMSLDYNNMNYFKNQNEYIKNYNSNINYNCLISFIYI